MCAAIAASASSPLGEELKERVDTPAMPNSRHKNITLARNLRRNQTAAEARLWSRLRKNGLGVKFRRQVPIGPYIADFASRTTMLVIEADGGQHGEMEAADHQRTEFLERRGYRVLRFWNMDILGDTDSVMDVIAEAVHWAMHPENEKD